jgi:hypothetical protein
VDLILVALAMFLARLWVRSRIRRGPQTVNNYRIKPGADLSGANLEGANLAMANLKGANLNGATLIEAKLEQVNLAGTEGFGRGIGSVTFRLAKADQDTVWPNWLDPVAAGVTFD